MLRQRADTFLHVMGKQERNLCGGCPEPRFPPEAHKKRTPYLKMNNRKQLRSTATQNYHTVKDGNLQRGDFMIQGSRDIYSQLGFICAVKNSEGEGWRDGPAVQSACCSYRSSHPSVTTPPGDPTPVP